MHIKQPLTISGAQKALFTSLQSLYDEREASNITDLIFENITGWKKLDRVLNKTALFPQTKTKLLQKYTEELLAQKPVQYVLNEAWFYGMTFFVNENVLIPRPETEELVKWVIDENNKDTKVAIRVLDIGTGSGCIPVALKKNLPQDEIYSCDSSLSAIQIARRNAMSNAVEIHFLHLDFLDILQSEAIPIPDIIISNPPYIPLSDRTTMSPHIVLYEPHQALFVPDADPLIFYKAIAVYANKKINGGVRIFLELPEDSTDDIRMIFQINGFNSVEIRKDMQGKDRMLKATRLP